MQVTQTAKSISLYQLTNQQVSKEQETAAQPRTDNTNAQTTKDQVTISSAGQNAQAKWQEVATKYDMSNVTTNERFRMATDLFENNLISSQERFILMAPLNMYDDGNTKANFTEIIRNSKAVAEGDEPTIKVLNILEQLHALAEKEGVTQTSVT